jgi:hypothetical protein
LQTITVGVGAVGTDLTQITSGLSSGQQVVIADLDQPLATSTSSANGAGILGGNSNSGARVGGAGGFGGAGRRAGG